MLTQERRNVIDAVERRFKSMNKTCVQEKHLSLLEPLTDHYSWDYLIFKHSLFSYFSS